MQRFINPKRSRGSYFTDTDGNVVLDLNCPSALGYNHDVHINARDSDFYDKFLSGKSNVSSVAPVEYVDALRENPENHDEIYERFEDLAYENEYEREY